MFGLKTIAIYSIAIFTNPDPINFGSLPKI